MIVDKGGLSAEGTVESAQEGKTVEITKATIKDVRVDYLHTAGTAVAEQERRAEAGKS